MKVSFKETIWVNMSFDCPQDLRIKINQGVKSGLIYDRDSLYSILFKKNIDTDQEFVIETSEQMSVSENSNQSTIEVWEEGFEISATNNDPEVIRNRKIDFITY